MQQLVRQKIHNLKRLAELYNTTVLIPHFNDAEKRVFPTVESVQQWFRSILDQEKNKDLVAKWKNVLDRMQIYRDVWKDIQKDNPNDVIEIYKVLNAAESKLDFLAKDEIVDLTTKVTIAYTKNPKVKELRDELKIKVQEIANLRKEKDKDKPARVVPTITQVHPPTQPRDKPSEPPANRVVIPEKPVQPQPPQKKPEKPAQIPSSRPQPVHFPTDVRRQTVPPKKEDKKQEISKVPEPREAKKQLPSYNEVKMQKPSAPVRARPFVNPHDQLRAIQSKLSTSGLSFGGDNKGIAALIKNELNLHMKGILIKLIRLASINNPQGNQDEFSYFSKKNETNPTLFPNNELSLQEKVPKKDRFYKIIYPHKLKVYSELRMQEQRQEQRLRVQDRRKRKEVEREIFQFVRGEPRVPRLQQYKQQNTKSEKLMIKLIVVQTMMEMDPFYSNSHILSMSYYL